MKTSPARKTGPVVLIDCPRCGGQGKRDCWHPDRGVCYLCHGKCSLEVNVRNAYWRLFFLRQEYANTLRHVLQGERDGLDMTVEREVLAHRAEKGQNHRALYELALAELERQQARKAAA